MSLTKSLLFTLLLSAAAVQASTRDEIERLWNPQGMATQPAQPAAGTSARTAKPAPRWFRLSNGRQVIRQGLFYPASPVEIVVSLSLTFSVSVVFFVGAIVGWISVSEIYYSRMTGLNESSEISEGTYNERK
ncbi:hypothetical protein U9X37_23080 [Escherichia coli]